MSYVTKVLNGTCPKCGQTKVFKKKGNPLLLSMPVMHENCENCGYSYHPEPGFYYGGMYMSYALTVAEMVAVFVIGLLLKMNFLAIFIGVVVVILLLSTFNYRMSRLMWLNLFYKNDTED